MPAAVVGNLDISTSFRDGLIEEHGPLSIDIVKLNCDLNGEQHHYNGAIAQPVTDDATNYFWLDLNGTLQTNTTGFPASAALRLGRVVTSGGYITKIIDDRAFLGTMSPEPTYSGSGNPNGAVSAQLGNTYRDLTNNIWYRCVSNPSGTEWTVV
jgi:hypothetical protein